MEIQMKNKHVKQRMFEQLSLLLKADRFKCMQMDGNYTTANCAKIAFLASNFAYHFFDVEHAAQYKDYCTVSLTGKQLKGKIND